MQAYFQKASAVPLGLWGLLLMFRSAGHFAVLLLAVFDPRGGYWQPGGKYTPSIIVELGHIVEKHLQYIGLLPSDTLYEHQRQLIDSKRQEHEDSKKQQDAFASEMPEGSQLCGKCHDKAVVMMDGCMTCLSCGDSKCAKQATPVTAADFKITTRTKCPGFHQGLFCQAPLGFPFM